MLLRAVWRQAVRMSGSSATNAKPKITIDITSDVVCPWCWVGKRHLDLAIKRVKDQYDFDIHWHPFALNPYVPEEGMLFKDYATMKFGEGAVERFTSGKAPFVKTGNAVGLQFNYSPEALVVPTMKAHILLEHVKKEGKQHQLHERLFRSYFSDSVNITEREVLGRLLEEVGVSDVEGALACLTNQKCIEEYKEGIREAQSKGITGVPYFEIYLAEKPSLKQQFSGAQPIDTFVAIFNRLCLTAKV